MAVKKNDNQEVKESGFGSVFASISRVTGVQVADLNKDQGINWLATTREILDGAGWDIALEEGSVSVQAKHVALFQDQGDLQGVVAEGDTVLENPTQIEDEYIVPTRFIQRIRLTQKTAAKANESDKTEE